VSVRSIVHFSLLFVFAGTAARAEQLFVEDKLVLNVYAAADPSSARIATIETGDAVESLERIDDLVHVRLVDGREGWVGANYLSMHPPAILELRDLQQSATASPGDQVRQLADQIAKLKQHNATLQSEALDLKRKLASAVGAAPAADAMFTPAAHALVEPNEPELGATRSPGVELESSHSRLVAWILPFLVLAASGAGYAVGYQTLGRRIRERFGGVKLY